MIEPIRDAILFTFVDQVVGGRLLDQAGFGLIMTNQDVLSQRKPRWGRVLAVGPEVNDVVPGQYVLIEPLMWTQAMTYDEVPIWKTDESKILAIADDLEDILE